MNQGGDAPQLRLILGYAAGAALISYGVLAIVLERNPSLIVPVVYTCALILLGFVLRESNPGGAWLGIALCLLSTWTGPLLRNSLLPLLPRDAFAVPVPRLITYVIFLIGTLILGASIRAGGPLHRSSGIVLAVAAASVLLLGSFFYALALAWVGYQTIPRAPRTRSQ
jgi:hypothetical protein